MKRRPLPTVREEVSQNWAQLYLNEATVYILVGLVGAASYGNSLDGELVHDDFPAIVTNGDVTGSNPVISVFRNDFWGTPMWHPTSHKSYRPLTTLTFRLNHSICGLSPWGWHAVNVLLHAVCCALVVRAAAVVRLRRPFAALAGILFAIHPIHTEAVSGVVGRADVLACLFFLTSLLLYHGSPSGKQYLWSSVLVAAVGMLAKEIGVTVLLFNIVFDIYLSWSSVTKCSSTWRWSRSGLPGRLLRAGLCLLVLVTARLAMLQGSLPAFSPQDNPPAFHPSFQVRLMTFSYLSACNWWLLLYPMTLSHDWQMGSVPLVTSLWDIRNLFSVAAALLLLALTWKCILDFDVQRHTPVVAGVLLLVIPYLPASNLLVTVGFVIAERVLYIPSVGSVLLTSAGMQLVWARRPSARLLIAAWLVLAGAAAGARTQTRNTQWRSRETLLRADLAVLPHNAKLHYNFANFLKDIEQQDNAINHYKEALRLWPSYASAHNNLATLLPPARAEHHFLLALRYNRDHVNAHYNLGKLYRKKNRFAESQRMLQRCISLEPRFVQAYIELLLVKPDFEKRLIFNKLLELEPTNWEHYVLYGNWLKSKGLKLASLQYYLEAMRLALRRRQTDRLSRGSLLSLRASCLLLRTMGQTARILQLLTRWQVVRGGCGPGSVKLLRSWQLRNELTGRAMLYDRHHHHHAIASTCLHHSQLEISKPTKNINSHRETHSGTKHQQLADKINNNINCGCQKIMTKKSISISPLYKPTHNKSDSEKSCPLNKKKVGKIKDTGGINYISEHLIKIKTY